MKVSAVFDIGKTNKKFFLFNKNYQEVFKEYSRFETILDEDGDACEDLATLENWMQYQFRQACEMEEFTIKSLNFSAYGASLVHIGEDHKPVAPLYDYLKPVSESIFQPFFKKYGGKLNICQQTASPYLGFLNSGLQLYWLKYQKPEIFEKIKWSLHLPQYLSYVFTGNPVSDFTSIGCHTTLWDFQKKDYHEWVYQEGIEQLLPPVVNTNTTTPIELMGRNIQVGVGIHDSSSALIPYIRASQKKFLLVSTGTWSISLNGFSQDQLTEEDLNQDCLNYMRINGDPVRSCRLFLGKEYSFQVQELHNFYQEEYGFHRQVRFDDDLYQKCKANYKPCFSFKFINRSESQPTESDLEQFGHFEKALHQLILELVKLQTQCIKRAIGNTEIDRIYIDGGFADNDIYVKMLADHLPDHQFRTTKSPLGSALGAVIVSSDIDLDKKFLKKKYAMKKPV